MLHGFWLEKTLMRFPPHLLFVIRYGRVKLLSSISLCGRIFHMTVHCHEQVPATPTSRVARFAVDIVNWTEIRLVESSSPWTTVGSNNHRKSTLSTRELTNISPCLLVHMIPLFSTCCCILSILQSFRVDKSKENDFSMFSRVYQCM